MIAVVALLAVVPSAVDGARRRRSSPPATPCALARREPRWRGVAAALALIGGVELSVAAASGAGVPVVLVIAPPAGASGSCCASAISSRPRSPSAPASWRRSARPTPRSPSATSARGSPSELHDIVAHAISVMVVQAAAGQRLARDPELTAETFAAIAGAARQAEEDMGRLVDAARRRTVRSAAAPDLALVEQLVARAAGSGLDVTLRLEGEREGLPAPAVQAACHVVQEGLTNALRYAAGAAVDVLVRGERDALVVSVENAPASHDADLAGVGHRHRPAGPARAGGRCRGRARGRSGRRRRMAAGRAPPPPGRGSRLAGQVRGAAVPVRRRTKPAISSTMTTPMIALMMPPRSKASSSPIPSPRVKIR